MTRLDKKKITEITHKSMTSNRRGLSDFHVLSIISGTVIGAGMITLPRTVAEYAGRDGWISVGISGIIVMLVAWLIYLLCSRFPERSLPDFAVLILGKPLGIIISSIYAIYALLLAATALRIYLELIKTWVFVWSPPLLLIIIILIPVVYISRFGAIAIGRLTEIILLISLPTIIIYILPLHESNILNILPVGAEGLPKIMAGVPESAFAYLGFEVLMVFFPFVKNKHKVLRVYLLTLMLVTINYMLNLLLIYSVMGIENNLLQIWPLINYIRIGTLPILDRIDNLFLFIWFAQVMAVVLIQYFAAVYTLSSFTIRKSYKLWATFLWPAIIILAILPNRLINALNFGNIVGFWGALFVVFLVLLLLVVSHIRKIDERSA